MYMLNTCVISFFDIDQKFKVDPNQGGTYRKGIFEYLESVRVNKCYPIDLAKAYKISL